MDKIKSPELLAAPSSAPFWETCEPGTTLIHAPGPIRTLQFERDGTLLSTSHDSTCIMVWDWQTGLPRFSLEHDHPVACFAVTHHGAEVLSNDSYDEARWDLSTGELKERRRVRHPFHHGALALAYGPEGRHLARADCSDLCSWGTSVDVFDEQDSRWGGISYWSQPFVRSLSFSLDGHWLASGWEYGYVKIWDLSKPHTQPRVYRHDVQGQPIHGQVLPATVRCVRYSPRGDCLAVACGSVILLRGIENRRIFARLTGHKDDVNSVAFTPDGETLLSASYDGLVKLWSVGARRNDRTIDWQIGAVSGVAVSPEGSMVAVGGETGQIVIWRLRVRGKQQ